MALVKMKELLAEAAEKNRGCGAFSVGNMEMVMGALRAAEELDTPIILQIAQVIYMGCLRGAGDTLYTAIASTISVTVIRTAGSWFFGYVLHWGIAGIWMGVVADQLSRFLFASIRFKRGKWTEIKI